MAEEHGLEAVKEFADEFDKLLTKHESEGKCLGCLGKAALSIVTAHALIHMFMNGPMDSSSKH